MKFIICAFEIIDLKQVKHTVIVRYALADFPSTEVEFVIKLAHYVRQSEINLGIYWELSARWADLCHGLYCKGLEQFA